MDAALLWCRCVRGCFVSCLICCLSGAAVGVGGGFDYDHSHVRSTYLLHIRQRQDASRTCVAYTSSEALSVLKCVTATTSPSLPTSKVRTTDPAPTTRTPVHICVFWCCVRVISTHEATRRGRPKTKGPSITTCSRKTYAPGRRPRPPPPPPADEEARLSPPPLNTAGDPMLPLPLPLPPPVVTCCLFGFICGLDWVGHATYIYVYMQQNRTRHIRKKEEK